MKTWVSIFGKELLKIKFYGRMKKYLKSFPFYWKGGVMGKSLNGKELGKGISQRKDGIYQGRFMNRFGKRQTIYATTLKEIRQKLRDEEYEDEKCVNVVRDMTLDEW